MHKETQQNCQRGFTVLELLIVMVVSSLLLVPLLKLVFTSVGGNRDQKTEAALEKAVDALVAYAADNNGCLPFAADFEGGLPDTDQDGAILTDTGVSKTDQRAGDLPWADLGLASNFLDGDALRIQYYVSLNYAGNNCGAGYRGQQWNPQVQYVGSDSSPIYIYVSADRKPELYTITDILVPGLHPRNSDAAEKTSKGLKKDLLRVRRGPDITSDTDGQSDEISKRNVFVLIAVGDNRNAVLDQSYVRDASHLADKDEVWVLGVVAIDKVEFSMTNDTSQTDRHDNGDDTLRVMSFTEYSSRLNQFDMILQPVCEESTFDVDCKE